jgi:hypothetical protein
MQTGTTSVASAIRHADRGHGAAFCVLEVPLAAAGTRAARGAAKPDAAKADGTRWLSSDRGWCP